MQTSKARMLLKETLHTEVEFLDSMYAHLKTTEGTCAFYENRLHFESSEQMWRFVDHTRQCRCCGQVLASTYSSVKLMSCGACKVVHYCNRECQKRHWKAGHKAVCRPMQSDKNIEAVARICVRALSLMEMPTNIDRKVLRLTAENPAILNSIFSFEKKDALSTAADAFAVQVRIDPLDNRVCNHFRETRGSNRILYPIWDTVTDNLVFIPVPLEFVFFVQGLPLALVKENEARIQKNNNVYGMFVKGVVDGNPGMVATHSFVSICEAES